MLFTKGYGKLVIGVAVLLMLGILAVLLLQSKDNRAEAPAQAAIPPARQLSVWITDWQWEEGNADWSSIPAGSADLQLFAAYFDERDELYFTDTLTNALPRLHELAAEEADLESVIGLTLVNDVIHADGSSVQKDSELLNRLTATEEARQRHIQRIAQTVEQYSLEQIEIDYEQVEEQDWPNMLLFYEELAGRLKEMNVSLRVVLEPRAPVEQLELPEGPEYVMMAYNLYGGHSGPGPKADLDFIAALAGRMSHIPGDPIIAFSTGGFDWEEEGGTSSLTEQSAADLADSLGLKPERDPGSGSVYFEYNNEAGIKHTVWYADDVTLRGWIDEASRQGIYKVALWRLGELGEETIRMLGEIK
ncbi:glycosyl hydrolase [Neobacillus mesonae]|nr:glycosyl hydrolase [Neobacillus mesonae]